MLFDPHPLCGDREDHRGDEGHHRIDEGGLEADDQHERSEQDGIEHRRSADERDVACGRHPRLTETDQHRDCGIRAKRCDEPDGDALEGRADRRTAHPYPDPLGPEPPLEKMDGEGHPEEEDDQFDQQPDR